MYPRLTDMINDLFGTNVHLPVQTFGFFMAMAFVGAFLVVRRELRRREALGQFTLRTERIKTGGPMHIAELIGFAATWTLIGYKLGLIFEDYDAFYHNPQAAIFSWDGWWPGAIAGLLIGGGIKLRNYLKRKDQEVEYKDMQVGPSAYISMVTTMAFIWGMIGAKVFAWFDDWEGFISDPLGSIFSFDGLAFFGGLFTAGFFITRFFYRKGFHVLTSIDAFVPCLVLALAIGRVGCQMAGDGDWGITNTAPQPAALSWLPEWTWAYDYPHNVVSRSPGPGLVRIDCLDEFCYKLAAPAYPTPLYETIMCLMIFGILMWARRILKFAGKLTAMFLLLMGVERFLIEKIRINPSYPFLGMEFTQAEFISMGMIIAAVILWIYVSKKGKRLDSNPPSEVVT